MTIQRFDWWHGGMEEEREGEYVTFDDHQAELAALREELAKAIELAGSNLEAALEFEACLTAAEQRNSELAELLTEHQWRWSPHDEHYHTPEGYYCAQCLRPKAEGHKPECAIGNAIKSTESGAGHDPS